MPWNKGRSLGQKRPFTPKQVGMIRDALEARHATRDLALFNTAIDTMLRAVDLLALNVTAITDDAGNIRREVPLRQRKTGVPHLVALSDRTRATLATLIQATGKKGVDPVFTRHKGDTRRPLTRRGYADLVKIWAAFAQVEDVGRISTHSLRRTKARHIFEKTGNHEVVRINLGQTSIASTSAYLGVEQRDALDIARELDI